MTTTDDESALRGGRKWGSNFVYDDDAEGTVYTDNRARVSAADVRRRARCANVKLHTFFSLVLDISKVISQRKVNLMLLVLETIVARVLTQEHVEMLLELCELVLEARVS